MVEQILDSIGAAIGSIIGFIPQLLAFLLVLGVGFLLAKGAQKLVGALLDRVGFDRLVERGGVKQWMARSRYDASDLLARGVFWVSMLFVLQLAFGVFGPNPVSAILTGLIGYLPNVFAAALIIIVAAAVSAVVRDVIDAATSALSYGRMLANGTAIAIMVVAAFAAASQLGIAPAIVNGLFYAGLAAVVGIAVVAIGGAGITPMREYWARTLRRLESEAPAIRAEVSQAPGRVEERTRERREQVRAATEEAREPVGAGMGSGGPERRR
ncbi:MAG: mechanosensitive ion channel family protein [Coriobacteriia bacterium]